MATDSIPNFAEDPAVKLWASVPDYGKRLILANVWCCRCRKSVTIEDYTGSIVGGDLLLSSKCSECQGDAARVVEMGVISVFAIHHPVQRFTQDSNPRQQYPPAPMLH